MHPYASVSAEPLLRVLLSPGPPPEVLLSEGQEGMGGARSPTWEPGLALLYAELRMAAEARGRLRESCLHAMPAAPHVGSW
jgi:hypothetical protein